MTVDLRKIDALIEGVAAGEVPDDGNNGHFRALGFYHMTRAWMAYRGSMDSMKALHDALLPDWDYRLERHGEDHFALVFPRGRMAEHADDWEASPVSAAHAWLLAMLRAHRANLEAAHG